MFSKKIVPDFTPRHPFVKTKETATAPTQEINLPPRILISESQKVLPKAAPPLPPSINRQEYISMASPPITQRFIQGPSLTAIPILDPTPIPGGNVSYSPSLETFTSIGESYFKLASDTGGNVSEWSLYPALQTVIMDGNSIEQVQSIGAYNIGISYNSNYENSLTANGNVNFQSTLTTEDMTVTSGAIKLTPSHILETIGGNLFFDTELLAKAGDIQNIADWSLYPALSTVNYNNEAIVGVSTINTQPLSYYTVSNWSQYPSISTINVASNNIINVSTINSLPYPPPMGNASLWSHYAAVSTVNIAQNDIINVSTINSLPYPPPGGDASLWSHYAAVSTVNMNGNQIANATNNIDLGNGSWTSPANNVFLSPQNQVEIGTTALANSALLVNNIAANGKPNGTVGQYLSHDADTIVWVDAPAGGVTSVNGAAGAISITSDPATVTTNTVGTTTTFSAPTLGVSTDVATTCFGVANGAALSATSAGLAAGAASAAAATAQATAVSAGAAALTAQTTASLALSQSGITSVNGGFFSTTIAAGVGIGIATTFTSGTTNPTVTITNTAAGSSGATGPTGPIGQSASYFNYQAQTPPAVPGSGHITWQATTQTASTYIRVNNINFDGVNISLFLTSIQVGSVLVIQDQTIATNFQRWSVSATPTIVATYVEYPVSLVSSGGANFANNNRIILETNTSSPAGPTGATGRTGPTGFTGATGSSASLSQSVRTFYVSKSGLDTNTGAIWSPFLTVGKAISLVTTPPTGQQWNIYVGTGIYIENIAFGNRNMIIQGNGTQESVYNTTLQGNHTYTVTNTSGNNVNQVQFRDIQLLPVANVATAMITLAPASLTNVGALVFTNCKFGDAGSGSGVGWISTNTTTSCFFTATNCKLVAGCSQAFSDSMLKILGTSFLTVTACYIEVDLAVSAIETGNSTYLNMTNSSVYNVSASVASGGLLYFNSIFSSTRSHAVGNCSFLCGSVGSGGQAAIVVSNSGQSSLIQNNGFAVRAGAPTDYCITSTGVGSTVTPIYVAGNTAAPSCAANVGPLSNFFAPIALTVVPNTINGGKFQCVGTSTSQSISIPGMTTTGLVSLTYLGPQALTQYFSDIVPALNGVTVSLFAAPSSANYIIWNVIRFS